MVCLHFINALRALFCALRPEAVSAEYVKTADGMRQMSEENGEKRNREQAEMSIVAPASVVYAQTVGVYVASL